MSRNGESRNYSINLLNNKDKETAEVVNKLTDVLFDKEVIEGYIAQHAEGCGGGAVVTALVSEIINPFSAYLKELADYFMCNFMIDKIDSYDIEEYRKLKEKAEELLNNPHTDNLEEKEF